MNDQDIVYMKHCCVCPLRHAPNCFYAECSFTQYCDWLEEAKHQLKNLREDNNACIG